MQPPPSRIQRICRVINRRQRKHRGRRRRRRRCRRQRGSAIQQRIAAGAECVCEFVCVRTCIYVCAVSVSVTKYILRNHIRGTPDIIIIIAKHSPRETGSIVLHARINMRCTRQNMHRTREQSLSQPCMRTINLVCAPFAHDILFTNCYKWRNLLLQHSLAEQNGGHVASRCLPL